MKIVHLLFDDYPYVIDWGYQENKYVKYQLRNHDVTIITGRYIPDILNGHLNIEKLKSYETMSISNHNLKIYRLNCFLGNSLLGKKIRYYHNLEGTLIKEKPDFIFVHDLHTFSLPILNRYLKVNKTKCIADVHVNYVNSCRNILSYFLHRYIYRLIIKNNISNISNIYYLNENSRRFIEELYGLEEIRYNINFLPLGGDLIDIKDKEIKQKKFKDKHHLSPESIIFVHSGKMNSMKKTLEILDAFSKTQDSNFYLLLIGVPSEEIKEQFFYKVNSDKRINYVGWKTNEELMDYLAVCDVYLQPGTPSVTAHEALCKGCATVLSKEGDFYAQFINDDSAIYLTDKMSLNQLFKMISKKTILLNKYKNNGHALAKRIFDYQTQSEYIIK